jgi:hypothetical protein
VWLCAPLRHYRHQWNADDGSRQTEAGKWRLLFQRYSGRRFPHPRYPRQGDSPRVHGRGKEFPVQSVLQISAVVTLRLIAVTLALRKCSHLDCGVRWFSSTRFKNSDECILAGATGQSQLALAETAGTMERNVPLGFRSIGSVLGHMRTHELAAAAVRNSRRDTAIAAMP